MVGFLGEDSLDGLVVCRDGGVTDETFMSRWMGREDSYAGAWESAGFGEDDHTVGAGDVAFDEVLGGG